MRLLVRSCALVASLLLLCCGSRAGSGGGPAGSAAPSPPAPRFWLVRTPLADRPGAEPSRTEQGPALVELLPDGKVRSVGGDGPAFEGYVPRDVLESPADRKGLMLYGQRTGEMHIDSPSGPSIGKVHPGAFVSAVAHDDGTWRIAVPRHGGESGDASTAPLIAYVDRDVLGVARTEQVAPLLPGKKVRDFRLDLWLPGQPRVFARLLCGELHVTGAEARQYADGIEVTGVLDIGADWPFGDRGEDRCPGRLVYERDGALREDHGRDWLDSAEIAAVPEGYLRFDVPVPDPLAVIIERRASMFWLVPTRRGVECHEWKITKSSRRTEPGEERSFHGEMWRLRDRIHAHYGVTYASSTGGATEGEMGLWGPYFDGGGYRCVRRFSLIGASDDVLYVESAGRHGAPEGWRPYAFHPDDMEHWFLKRDACEAEMAHAAEALSKDSDAYEHLGLHHDCFEELYR